MSDCDSRSEEDGLGSTKTRDELFFMLGVNAMRAEAYMMASLLAFKLGPEGPNELTRLAEEIRDVRIEMPPLPT